MTVKKTKTKKEAKKTIKWYEEALELYDFLLDEFVVENELLDKAVRGGSRAYTELKTSFTSLSNKCGDLRKQLIEETRTSGRYHSKIVQLSSELDDVKGDRNFFIVTTIVMIVAYAIFI